MRFTPFMTGSAVAQQIGRQLLTIKRNLSSNAEITNQYISQLEEEIADLKRQKPGP